MGLERLNLRQKAKGWELRRSGKKIGGTYRSKAEAIAAAEDFAKHQNDNFIVYVDRSEPRRTTMAHGARISLVKETVPRQRYPRRNPLVLTLRESKFSGKASAGKIFRETVAELSTDNPSLKDSDISRESIYKDHD